MKKQKITQKIMLILLMTAFISSCSIQKRRYSDGWNLSFNKGTNQIEVGTTPAKKKNRVETPSESIAAANIAQSEEIISTNEEIATESTPTDEVVISKTETPIESNQTASVNKAQTLALSSFSASKSVHAELISNFKNEKLTPKSSVLPAQKDGGDKSWLVTVLLCFFIGGLGIHRFYLGYTWQGVVQLLTLGGLGIWWLIDFIRILIRDLEPKDGSYDD